MYIKCCIYNFKKKKNIGISIQDIYTDIGISLISQYRPIISADGYIIQNEASVGFDSDIKRDRIVHIIKLVKEKWHDTCSSNELLF